MSLRAETAQNFVGISSSLEDFDCDLLLKLSVSPCRKINCPHFSASNFPQNFVGTQALANLRSIVPTECRRRIGGAFFKGIVYFVQERLGLQNHGLGLKPQGRVVGARVVDIGSAFARGIPFHRIRKNGF